MKEQKALAFILLCLFSIQAYASELKVTILGSGTPVPSIERFGSSTLIEYKDKKYLFDVGRGTTIRLSQIGINPSEIDHLFLTHLHSDHITGFADFWLTGWIWQRKEGLNVYGPDGVENFISHTQKTFSKDIAFRKKHTGLLAKGLQLNVKEVQQGIIYKNSDIKITAIKVEHGAVEQAFGYRFDTGNNAILLSGDTTFSENLVKHGENLDLLIHELAVIDQQLIEENPKLKKISQYHSSLHQVKQVIDLLEPELTIFNHLLIIGIEQEMVNMKIQSLFKDKAVLGYDLQEINLPE